MCRGEGGGNQSEAWAAFHPKMQWEPALGGEGGGQPLHMGGERAAPTEYSATSRPFKGAVHPECHSLFRAPPKDCHGQQCPPSFLPSPLLPCSSPRVPPAARRRTAPPRRRSRGGHGCPCKCGSGVEQGAPLLPQRHWGGLHLSPTPVPFPPLMDNNGKDEERQSVKIQL